MVRLYSFILLLLSLTGCNLFRKKTESTLFSAGRDSSWRITSVSTLQGNYTVKNSSGSVALEARGFDEFNINKDGNINAKGKNGVLIYTGTTKDSSATGASYINNTSSNSGHIQDSINLNEQVHVDAGAKVDKWFSWWFVVGGIIVAIVLILVFSNVGWPAIWNKIRGMFKAKA
ncbi:hypothetical protein ACR789_14085 [Sphingobacterium siyangense]|uniref:hypothetical protein n=1 Tax=Sphingobacterium TaxID=28453 RepID=UPI0025945F4D|nr:MULTISPECIES: hypothetical protein [Sphingobacterium]